MDITDVIARGVTGEVPEDRKFPTEEERTIFEFDNFVPDYICDRIVEWFKAEPKMPENGQSLFNGRQINYDNVSNDEIKKYMAKFKADATVIARENFNTKLYVDYTDLVYWDDGSGMLVHADNADENGNPNYVHWRTHAGVLYLNDDYLGGETFFPDHGPHFIKPKKGKFSLFPAGWQYRHGVSTVVGQRYTMPIWFTENPQYIET